MRWLHVFADPALRHELAVTKSLLADEVARSTAKDAVILEQAELIRQFRAEGTGDNERRCFCPESRRQRWREGLAAGPNGVVGDSDDDWVPA